ncbi:MAG TPA: IclR family transcriptional regulator [Actinomycetota bacterium]|nr:IclR family transcriptional regulator [Actinomycetota bacterium]
MSKTGRGRTLSTALHALEALEFVTESPRGVSVKGVARALNLSLSSAYSLVNSLRAEQFVVVSPSGPGLYVLGPRVLELYRSYVQSRMQPEHLGPFLEELRERASARAYAAMWKEGDLEVSEILGRRGARELQDISVGFRGAAHALALGKLYLAELPEDSWPRYLRTAHYKRFTRHTMTTATQLRHNLAAVRQRGLALDIEEYAENVCCISAPVRDERGRLIATIGASTPARRFRYQYKSLARAVRDTAEAASAELGAALGKSPEDGPNGLDGVSRRLGGSLESP